MNQPVVGINGLFFLTSALSPAQKPAIDARHGLSDVEVFYGAQKHDSVLHFIPRMSRTASSGLRFNGFAKIRNGLGVLSFIIICVATKVFTFFLYVLGLLLLTGVSV